MEMDCVTFCEFVKNAHEQEAKERYFNQWVVQLPVMDKENYISFDDYCKKVTGQNIDMRPAEEIMAEVEEIRRQARSK